MPPPPSFSNHPKSSTTRRVFGQATRYQRQFGGGGAKSGMGKTHSRIRTDREEDDNNNGNNNELTAAQRRRAARERADYVETQNLGVQVLSEGSTERGWLYNIVSTTVRVKDKGVFSNCLGCNAFSYICTLAFSCLCFSFHLFPSFFRSKSTKPMTRIRRRNEPG